MGRVRPCIALGGLSWVQKFGPKSVSESDHKALFLSAARATVTAHLDFYWCKPSQKSQRARTSFPEGRQCVRVCECLDSRRQMTVELSSVHSAQCPAVHCTV